MSYTTIPRSRSHRVKTYIINLPDLIAYYPLNELSGNAINRAPSTFGTYNGVVTSTTQGVAGKLGRAYSFDGIDDGVLVTGLIPTLPLSVIVFVNQSKGDVNDRILDQASGGPINGWNVGVGGSNNFQISIWDGAGNTANVNYLPTINNDTWYLLGVSISATSLRTYLNGVYTGNQDTSVDIGTVTANLSFGKRTAGSNFWKGLLQHIAIFNRSLAATEHLKLAQLAGLT